ncbi:MAG: ABC transporter substrate-binding protein [bacterium]|nr:ABC transporter substrate-binding protein [bacterium]
MRIVVPDLITNSYFPALAAEELGLFQAEGLDAHVELLTPAPKAVSALRDGSVDAVATGSHMAPQAFPNWQGAKLIVALSQGTPWLLVLRADLGVARGDLQAIKGLRIGAAPGPESALRRLLAEAGIDPLQDQIQISQVPGADAPDVSFGILAAQALEAGQLDGFWANALGSETAVRRGVGAIIVDVRRGDGPPSAKNFTFSALLTTDTLIERHPEQVAAAVRGIIRAQQVLRTDPTQATIVGQRRFPPDAAALIATLVERDLPFYDPVISEYSVNMTNRFAQALGFLDTLVPYEQVVATQFRHLWHAAAE